jgi:hypothetical protein
MAPEAFDAALAAELTKRGIDRHKLAELEGSLFAGDAGSCLSTHGDVSRFHT